MKKFYLFLLLSCIICSATSYSQFATPQWQHVYDTARAFPLDGPPYMVHGSQKLHELADGNFVLVADFNNDVAVYKLDRSGNVLWRKIFGGNGTDNANMIKLTRDGGFVIVGKTNSNEGLFTNAYDKIGYNAFLAKTDSGGNLQWVKLIGGTGYDVFNTVEVLGDGYVAIGATRSTDGDITANYGLGDVLVSRFGGSGNTTWNKTYGSANCDRGALSLLTKKEDIIIGGLATTTDCISPAPARKICFAIDKNGAMLWRNDSLALPAGGLGLITNLAFSADSTVFYSIVRNGPNDLVPAFNKYNSNTGILLSSTPLSIPISGDFGVTTIQRTADGHYLLGIASQIYSTSQPKRTFLAEIEENGDLVSLNQFDFGDETIVDILVAANQAFLLSNSPSKTRLSLFDIRKGAITSFTPASGSSGTVVKITGSGFTGATKVSFGGIDAASSAIVSDTEINAVVGAGGSGHVLVGKADAVIATKAGFAFVTTSPSIKSFTPASAIAGTVVNITGAGLTGATGVQFGTQNAASFTVVNDTLLKATVGTGATGAVAVTTPLGTASRSGFTFTIVPSIASFSPAEGNYRDTVLIKGRGFTGTTAVYFGGPGGPGGPSLYFNVVNDTTLYAEVSPTGIYGNITVVTPFGSAVNGPFSVVSKLNVSYMNPYYGTVGDTVAAVGNNFSPVIAENKVYFGTAQATVVSASNFSLKVIVPPGATTDYVVVKREGVGSGHSFDIFQVLLPGDPAVFPWGTTPVSGAITKKVTVDPVVNTYEGHAYVQRHYDIVPANNPATSSAQVVLFYTQQDFDNFNAHPAHGLDLPKNPTDEANKANLRVYQYHGFSTTSLPSSYNGGAVEIDPADYDIIWNYSTKQWAVTFIVDGFSGFFVSSVDGRFVIPPTPAIGSIASSYCSSAGVRKGKLSNLPQDPGTTIMLKLDGKQLAVAADSTFSFDLTTLAAGPHTLNASYSNLKGTKIGMAYFDVTAATVPAVDLSANITTITSLAAPVIVTATSTGGGTSPLYTFAKDKNFTNILQMEGAGYVLQINPSNLTVGDNKIYVRMKTSATCYTEQVNTDSILLKRDATTGIVDPENPGRMITISPNPFEGVIRVNGLHSGHKYSLVLYDTYGHAVYTGQVSNKSVVEIPATGMRPGAYWLSIYDGKKKLLGTDRIVKY